MSVELGCFGRSITLRVSPRSQRGQSRFTDETEHLQNLLNFRCEEGSQVHAVPPEYFKHQFGQINALIDLQCRLFHILFDDCEDAIHMIP